MNASAHPRRGRPPKLRSEVKSVHVGFKMTTRAHAMLLGLIKEENEALGRLGYRTSLTIGEFVVTLIQREWNRQQALEKAPQ